eukprot:GHVU01041439.1.p3 GENE.GHVU01041439.1~~GHVU01041439.1.p3  ORF type:complete len:102 (-),score=6.12 GHVU01041439.1:83-388(-)
MEMTFLGALCRLYRRGIVPRTPRRVVLETHSRYSTDGAVSGRLQQQTHNDRVGQSFSQSVSQPAMQSSLSHSLTHSATHPRTPSSLPIHRARPDPSQPAAS